MTPAMGAAGAGAAMPIDSLACIVTPAMTEGPFFVEEKLNRADLTLGETDPNVAQALKLKLVIGVYDVNGMMCTPIRGATVDIWHANAMGIYSDEASGVIQSEDTRGKKYLRGYQTTDEAGLVTFATVYPGWYMGRAIHIHFKLRMLGSGASQEFTSQMFFDEMFNSMVMSQPPYKAHGERPVKNEDDHIYSGTAQNGQKPAGGKLAPGLQIMPKLTLTTAGVEAVLKIGLKA